MNGIIKNVGSLNKTKKELIKKLKQLETEREKFTSLNNDLNNFVHAVSHDLKSPLNHLKGLVELLSISVPAGSDQTKLLELINLSVVNLKTRIEDLSVLGAAQDLEGFNSQDLSSIMEEVKFDLQQEIESAEAEIIEDFSNAPSLNFSKKNIRSILFNLICNAIKYRSPYRKPIITITSEATGKKGILLKVTDNGLGIREEDKYKIFLMYKRLVDHVEGKGIGLALVKRIVDNAGGRIELESEYGVGSTFKVYLKG